MYVMQCFGEEVTEREQGSGWLAGRGHGRCKSEMQLLEAQLQDESVPHSSRPNTCKVQGEEEKQVCAGVEQTS